MEILNFLNFKFEDLHKAKKPGYNEPAVRASRAEERRITRRLTRQTNLLVLRNITDMECVTPKPFKPATKGTKVNRLELLKKWKIEKEAKLKKEKESKKPTFRVGGAVNIGFPSTTNGIMDYSFAPKNSGFKAPNNIKPIKMNLPPLSKNNLSKSSESVNKKVVKLNNSVKSTQIKKNIPTFSRVTRSQKPVASPPLPLPARKNIITKKTNITSSSESISSKVKSQSNFKKSIVEKNKVNITAKTKVKPILKQTNNSKVKFQLNFKTPDTDENTKITYKKTPKPINKIESESNEITDEEVNDSGKKTPSKRKSLKGRRITRNLKDDNDISLSNTENIKSPIELKHKTNKRKSLQNKENLVQVDINSSPKSKTIQEEIINPNKKTRKRVHVFEENNVLKESNESDVKILDNDIQTEGNNISRRKTRRSIHKRSEESEIKFKESPLRMEDNGKRKSIVKNIQPNIEVELKSSDNSFIVEENVVVRKTRRKTRKSSFKIVEQNTDTEIKSSGEEGNISKINTRKSKRSPRCITNIDSNKDSKISVSSSTPKTPKINKKKIIPDVKQNSDSSSLSTSYSSNNCDTSLSDAVFETPENKTIPNIYISPYVTTSRGKGSTKKENKSRQSRGLAPFTEHTPDENNQAGAAYFHTVLDNAIERLLDECKVWDNYKESGDVTDEAGDLIDVAVGQAHLLINKKFQQFRNLINNCQNGDGEGKVTCADLQGFWDMVYIQVDNLNIRFKRLLEMKENNWEEIQPVIKKNPPVNKRAPVKLKPTVTAKSSIRDVIRAARLKSNNQLKVPKTDETVFNGGFFVVKSPNKINSNLKTPNKNRKSLLASVLSTEAKKATQKLAPGLTTLRLSQTFKSVGKNKKDLKDLNQTLPTPGKSILKKSSSLKPHNISKVVLFKDEDSDSEEENILSVSQE